MTTIQIPDDQAAALRAKAAAAGMTLELWLAKLAYGKDSSPAEPSAAQPSNAPPKHISEVIREIFADVPTEDWDALPRDGASQHDHYIYGLPKREP